MYQTLAGILAVVSSGFKRIWVMLACSSFFVWWRARARLKTNQYQVNVRFIYIQVF